jgi:rare lipoprotein A (peptidoglycan hydrolase)
MLVNQIARTLSGILAVWVSVGGNSYASSPQAVNFLFDEGTNKTEQFMPKEKDFGLSMASVASWYGPGFYGNRTANGEIYTGGGMTAAHKYLPFGTKVRVTNHNNGRSVVVRINDRGPYVGGRVIDLSHSAARVLGVVGSGTAPVSLQVLR